MSTQTNLDISNMKPVASTQTPLELTEFHMKPSTIGKITIVETTKGYVDGKWVEELPVPQKQLLVESIVLKTLKDSEGKDVPICAKEWFNLTKIANGEIGWSTHEKGKLNNFLRAEKCAHPKDLVGKPCIINVVEKNNNDGTKTQLLRFMY